MTNTKVLSKNSTVVQAIEQAQELLQKKALNSDFIDRIGIAFGDRFDTNKLNVVLQHWSNSDFSNLPAIEILPTAEINGANGAFSSQTNTIYLSQELIAENTNPQLFVNVLLEEIGHWVDAQINSVDTPGDEGAIFSSLVRDQPLSQQQLQFLRAEDDTATLTLNGQSVAIEQDSPYTGTNLGQLKDGLNQLFDTLQSAINNQVFGNSLPLLGDTLKTSTNDTVQFIKQLRNSTNTALSNPDLTPEQIRTALENALNSLGVLQNIDKLESADDLQYSLKLAKAPTTFSSPLDTNIGLKNLGLQVNGNANTSLDYGLQLNFGMNKTTGFYLNTSAADELNIGLNLTPKFDATANLGFFKFQATDQGSKFDGKFSVDLKDLNSDNKLTLSELSTIGTNYQNLLSTKLNGNADVKLKLDAGTGIKGLPSLQSDFGLKWQFDPTLLIDTTRPETFGKTPEINFNNVKLNLGSVLSDFVSPVLSGVKDVVEFEPLQKALGILTNKLPVINTSSLLDIAEKFGGGIPPGTNEFIDDLKKIADLGSKVSTISANGVLIDLGSFNLGTADPRSTEFQLSNVTPQKPPSPLAASSPLPSDVQSFLAGLSKVGLEFPILNDPDKAFSLLLGRENVDDLFTYTTPKLELGLNLPLPPIPIPPLPLHIDFSIGANAAAQFKFGYDTTGLQAFKNTGYTDTAKIFNGFFVDNPSAGQPVFSVGAGITGEAVAEGGIVALSGGGTIDGSIGLELANKVRPNQQSGCLFELSGAIGANLFASFRIGFGFLSYKRKFTLARFKLADFRAGCTEDNSNRNLATKGSDGKLEVSAGANQRNLIGITGASPDEVFVIGHESGSAGQETVAVMAYGVTNVYDNVSSIVIDSGEGNDTITVEEKVLSPATLLGGNGDDDLQGGDGNDTIDGGNNDDLLNGGKGEDNLNGGAGDDIIIGGAGNDTLDGGGGIDTVSYEDSPLGVDVNLATGVASDGYGSKDTLKNFSQVIGSNSPDTLIANDFGNVLDAGGSDDTVIGGAGNDFLLGGSGKDFLDGKGGNNGTSYIYSTAGVVIDLNTGKGRKGDAQGDQLVNIQSVQGSNLGDRLIGNSDNNYLDGASGDDVLIGGAGADTLDGGAGIDWASYKSSPGAVIVSLKTGSGTGVADSAGDKLVIKDKKGNDIIYNSIENLEGSNLNDVLEGDAGENILKGLKGIDTLKGDDGNDRLIGGADADRLDGGSGFDWADYSDSPAAVKINLKENTGFGGDAEGDTFEKDKVTGFSTVENLRGTDFADTLVGDDGINEFAPGYSSYGIDEVRGEGNSDRLIIDYSNNAGFDVGSGITGGFFTGSPDSGFISRNTSDGRRVLDGVTFSGIERLLLIGTLFNDSVFSGPGDDQLLTGDGDDTIFGGLGSNTIFAGDGKDVVVDQNDLSGEFSSYPNNTNNIINLDGGKGIDTLSVDLSGKFSSIVLESTNPLQENPNQQFSTADGTVSIRNFEIFKDINTGSGNNKLTQLGRINNKFNTGSGNDEVNPGLGIDTVDGGSGPTQKFPTYSFTNPDDDLLILDYSVEDTGSGMKMYIDSEKASGYAYRTIQENVSVNVQDGQITNFVNILDAVNFKHIERFKITGTSKADTLITGNGNDQVFAGGGNDSIIGGRGSDQLDSGDGNDILIGVSNLPNGGFGTGEIDTLTGGAGADKFCLGDINFVYYDDGINSPRVPNDYALIKDFKDKQGDVIELHGSKSDYSLKVDSVAGSFGTLIYNVAGINTQNSELIGIVEGVTDLNLDANYFTFLEPPIVVR